jgi:hypothetical protein
VAALVAVLIVGLNWRGTDATERNWVFPVVALGASIVALAGALMVVWALNLAGNLGA